MSKKRFKGKTCTYCATLNASTTGDHVFGREFFPIAKRQNLPQVPACDPCNNEKSKLEHYLTAVMPFGGTHPDASEMLNAMVPGRLAKNAKLHRQLATGQTRMWKWEGGRFVSRMGLPFDSEKLVKLFEFIAKGLAFYHWGVVIPADHNVRAGMITAFGETQFMRFFAMNGNRVRESWGEGAFTYDGLQSGDNPTLTIWRFEAYGSIKLSGDRRAPNETPSSIWVTTSRSGMFAALLDGVPLPTSG